MYTKLAQKHEIWAIMYESFPSITLALYASLMADSFSFSLISSIMFSCVTIAVNVWRYLFNVSVENKKSNPPQNVEVTIELASVHTQIPSDTFDPETEMIVFFHFIFAKIVKTQKYIAKIDLHFAKILLVIDAYKSEQLLTQEHIQGVCRKINRLIHMKHTHYRDWR